MPTATEAALAPFNRKYLGSKRLLRRRIADRIVEAAGVPESFLDGFCGTGAVSLEMLARGAGRVTAVDTLRSNCVVLRGACGAPADPAGRARLLGLLGALNGLEPRDGYITESYAGTYFTAANCRRMDAVREAIEQLGADGAVGTAEHEWLLGCFLLAADRVANTLGQYDAYLKHIDAESTVGGRHVRDGRVTDAFALRPLAAVARGGEVTVVEADLAAGPGLPAVDVAYLRPAVQRPPVLRQLPRAREPRPVGPARARTARRASSTGRGCAAPSRRAGGRPRRSPPCSRGWMPGTSSCPTAPRASWRGRRSSRCWRGGEP